jgi:hypothetical protein
MGCGDGEDEELLGATKAFNGGAKASMAKLGLRMSSDGRPMSQALCC